MGAIICESTRTNRVLLVPLRPLKTQLKADEPWCLAASGAGTSQDLKLIDNRN